ncbi:MAG: ATP-binding cassette domain-containing protein [Armatimonadetes bacterium]|nr:ATP-binding cassette domain-containing protein [Armatimonadota bacterium]
MIVVRQLTKRFGEKVVLEDIDLHVEKGEIVALMGSSGGGKTTLLKCITGLIPPSSGTIEVAGVSVLDSGEAARHKMGLVFQSAALFDFMNVRDNVLFGPRRWMKLTRGQEEELLTETLDAVGMADSAELMPSELSGGMKKRVGIARAIALKPEVMLYDEPTTGLDPVTAYTIDSLIAEVNRRFEVTSLVVSHDVTSVMRVADRVVFLEGGKIRFDGPPSAFKASDYPAVAELVSKSRAESL